ncbi:mitochondrial carrier domain-containing protein [Globomyces pollinis-pini]|nr:mitochondrial carrier domain-containing protein [Globomyces pollinis-pini]
MSLDNYIGFIAGIASGATKLLIGHPFDTIKVRVQTEGFGGRFKGPLHCLKETIRNEGIRGMYKGATPPLFGWAMMDSIQLGTLTNLRLLLKDDDKPLTVPQHALAGLGTGIVVSFVATPIEVLKANLQIQYGKDTTRYSGPIDCAKKLYKDQGIAGIYRGLSGCLLFRSFFWLLWGSYEVYSNTLVQHGVDQSLIPFLAGGLAANTFWTVSFPADVIKNKLMTRPTINPKFRTIAQCARYIYSTDGIKGFYRGFVPCFIRSFPTNGAAIFVFETISSFGKNYSKNN